MQRSTGFVPSTVAAPGRYSVGHHSAVGSRRAAQSTPTPTTVSFGAQRRRPPRVAAVRMKFVQVRVPLPVEVPRAVAFGLFADLEGMPEWSRTLATVRRDPLDETLSHWTFDWRGVRLSWSARDRDRIELERIAWESVDGLTHKGRVDFVELGPAATEVTMTVDYDVAAAFAVIMETRFIQGFVESAIKADLERFRTYALRMQRRAKMGKLKSVP